MSANGFVAKYFDPSLRYYVWNAEFEDKRLNVDLGVEFIVFKDLTVIPYGLVTNKKVSPETIHKILQRFTLRAYHNSIQFYNDVKDLVEDRKLTKSYFIETLGPPTRILNATDVEDEKWYLDPLKLEISFNDSVAVGFKSKNYLGNIGRRFDAVDDLKFLDVPCDKFYCLTKVIKKGKTHYFLELYSEDEIYSTYSPIRIVLKGGKEIRRNNEAGIPDDKSGPKTFGRFYLTQAEATLLSSFIITDFKLGDVHEVMPSENGERLNGYFKALLNMK